MGSVFPIPAIFLVAAGLFLISVAMLVMMPRLGRRWLIGPLRQLREDVQESEDAYNQPPLSALTARILQETTSPEASDSLETKWVRLHSAKESGNPVADEAPQDDLRKDVILTDVEESRNIKASHYSPSARKQNIKENDLYEICCLIHDQLKMSMGEVGLLAVLYDTGTQQIETVYPTDKDEQANISIEDEWLWSIVRSGQTLQETTQAGVSWLGVPIQINCEVLGALAAYRKQLTPGFDETYQRLLGNLAAQVAIALRSQRQAATYQQQAEQSHSLASLTRKIWSSTDKDVILRTALEEIGHTLHASSGLIQLEYSFEEEDSQPGSMVNQG